MYTVVRVRKEWSADHSHRHIEGVLTASNAYYSCQDVALSIDAGDDWNTNVDGYSARISVQGYCPNPTCSALIVLGQRSPKSCPTCERCESFLSHGPSRACFAPRGIKFC